jgi:hypothetical protein
VGGSSAVIEFVALELMCISPNKEKYRFISTYDGSIEQEARKGKTQVTNLDKPVVPFVIEKGRAKVKEITFNRTPRLDFINGEYILEMYIYQYKIIKGFGRGFLVD